MAGNRYLLDTHCLIWFQENNPKIPDQVMKLIREPENVILFSQVSLFEIGIKQRVGKLPKFEATTEEIYNQAMQDGFTFLAIQNEHIFNYSNIPLVGDHRDPFDRLLISAAISEKAMILSADEKLSLYADLVTVIW